MSNVIYKHILKKEWAKNHVFKIDECNTSVKCSNCCTIERMSNVYHKHMNGKIRMVYGMYQCRNHNCNMTWGSRDTNACNGILRNLFCLMHNHTREYTYLVKRRREQPGGRLVAPDVPCLDPNRTNKYPKPLHNASDTPSNATAMDIGTLHMQCAVTTSCCFVFVPLASLTFLLLSFYNLIFYFLSS